MKKLGIGVDIINNSRIKRSITNKRFLTKVFSNTEITNSKKIFGCRKKSHVLSYEQYFFQVKFIKGKKGTLRVQKIPQAKVMEVRPM